MPREVQPAAVSPGAGSRKVSPARMGRSGETVVAAALKSQKQRGAVILGDGTAQVQLSANYVKKNVPKPADIRAMLLAAVRSNVLFGALGENEVEDLVDAMEPRHVTAGTVVISQGDPGDNFYVIETGAVSADDRGPLRCARVSVSVCLRPRPRLSHPTHAPVRDHRRRPQGRGLG